MFLVRIVRGNLATHRADAIVNSANPSLSGAFNTSYWRFNGRRSVDGALHEAAGQDALRSLSAEAMRAASLQLLLPGQTLVTPPSGRLVQTTKLIIHTVAPDGLYGAGVSDDQLALLKTSYAVAMATAEEHGATSVAIPAIGVGVNGWHPAVAARQALNCALDRARAAPTDGSLRRIDFVLKSDSVWSVWQACATKLLGKAIEPVPDTASDVDSVCWSFPLAANHTQ